jgi:hypothetical protein
MNGDRKIKRFDEFMNNGRLHRHLNLTIIVGTIKGGFFSKDIPFELSLYHTQIKHRVLDYKVSGATLKNLKIEVKIGDSIEIFRSWAASNGYRIEEYVR